MAAVATEEAPWCKMPMELICDDDITKSDLKVYGYLAHRAGPRGWFYAPIADIISALNLSDKMIRLACQKLKVKGYLTTKRLGKAQHFWLKFTISPHKHTSENDDADVFGNPLPNSDPDVDIVSGNQLPDDQTVFGNQLPDPPVTDYRNTTETPVETPGTTTETPSSAPPGEKSPATRRARAPDPFWDALLEGIGHTPPPSKRGAWNKAIADLKAMDATPADIIERCAEYRRKKSKLDLTATGLVSCWYDVAPNARSPATSPPRRLAGAAKQSRPGIAGHPQNCTCMACEFARHGK